MKTARISLLTFMIGLFVGAGHHFMSGVLPESGKAAGDVSAEAAALQKSGGVAAMSALDAFAEWETALKAGKLANTKLRADLLDRMAAQDPERAWRLMLASGLPVVLADIERLARAWQEKDPRAAAEFGLKLTDPLQRPAFLRQALTLWFLGHPQKFAAWMEGQAGGGADLVSHIHWGNMVYRPNITTLADLAAMMRVSPPTSYLPDMVGRNFHAIWKQPTQRQAATDWLRGMEDREVRDTTWRLLIDAVSKDDPQAAAALLGEIGDEKMRRRASSTIAAHLARSDPQAALAYAASLPDETSAATARQSALSNWAVNEPKQALDFIRQNPETTTMDDLGPARWQLGRSKPAEALEAVARFPESEARTDLMREVFSEWFSNAPREARKWLESEQAAVLPGTDITSLRERARPSNDHGGSTGSSTTINGRRVNYAY